MQWSTAVVSALTKGVSEKESNIIEHIVQHKYVYGWEEGIWLLALWAPSWEYDSYYCSSHPHQQRATVSNSLVRSPSRLPAVLSKSHLVSRAPKLLITRRLFKRVRMMQNQTETLKDFNPNTIFLIIAGLANSENSGDTRSNQQMEISVSPRFNWKEVESSSRSLRYHIITKSQILLNWLCRK